MKRAAPFVLMLALTACGATPQTHAPGASKAESEQIATAAALSAPAPGPASAAEQAKRYDQNDPGDAGAALPAAIARGLGTDELVLSCATGTREGVSQFAADWVGVRRLDLNRDGRADWIVNGRNRCLRLPDAAYWWIYEDTGDTPRLLLRAELAATLEILPSQTQGFRDLRIHLVSGRGAPLVADTRYDGEAYVNAPL